MAGRAGSAPGALESLVETPSDDDWSVVGVPGGMNPVRCDIILLDRGGPLLPG